MKIYEIKKYFLCQKCQHFKIWNCFWLDPSTNWKILNIKTLEYGWYHRLKMKINMFTSIINQFDRLNTSNWYSLEYPWSIAMILKLSLTKTFIIRDQHYLSKQKKIKIGYFSLILMIQNILISMHGIKIPKARITLKKIKLNIKDGNDINKKDLN